MDAHENIRTVEDLLSIAERLERESADRYRSFAARFRAQGDTGLAGEFDALAELEDRHVGQIGARASEALGRPVGPPPTGWRSPTGFEAGEAISSAYQALAFAVRNEERAFVFYAYVAAAAADDAVRGLAESLARDELDHASRLRRLRRRAFHQDRPVDTEIPASVERLLVLARQWDRSAATAHAGLADRLETSGRRQDAAIFRRLAAEEEEAAGDAPVADARPLASVEEGLLLVEERFDRLALIGDRAQDERVVAEAQRLAERTIVRLALAGEALDPGAERA